MEYINLRKLSADALEQVRSQVVRLKEMGKTGKEIEEITGVRPNRISEIWTAYQKEGKNALRTKRRGRKKREGMLLTSEEQRQIRQTIISKAPNQLKLAGFLWTLAKISQYIWTAYGKKVSVRCLSNYMKRWGLTCQRPTKRACGQDITRIETFKQCFEKRRPFKQSAAHHERHQAQNPFFHAASAIQKRACSGFL